MKLHTKDALKQDYKNLINQIENKLHEVEGTLSERRQDIRLSASERVRKLEDRKKELQAKYQELEDATEDKLERLAESMRNTYNNALEDLSGWLKGLKSDK